MTGTATPWSSICNFSGVPIDGYELDLPEGGMWHEILNTDAGDYGGSGVGNLGVVHADRTGARQLVLPPLGVLWLRHEPERTPRPLARRAEGLEQQRGQPAARADDARVGVADESEQLEEALADGRALVCGQQREQVEQPIERVVDVAAGEVEVGDRAAARRCRSGAAAAAARAACRSAPWTRSSRRT